MAGYKDLIEEAQRLVYEEWIERDGAVVDRSQIIDELIDALMDATRRRAVVEAQALEQAAEDIDEHYPGDIFIQPTREQYRVAAELLVGAGTTLDRFSADLMRRSAELLRARAVEIREGRQ